MWAATPTAVSMVQTVKKAVKSALWRMRCPWPPGAHAAALTAPSRWQAPGGALWRFARPGGGAIGTPVSNNCTENSICCSQISTTQGRALPEARGLRAGHQPENRPHGVFSHRHLVIMPEIGRRGPPHPLPLVCHQHVVDSEKSSEIGTFTHTMPMAVRRPHRRADGTQPVSGA